MYIEKRWPVESITYRDEYDLVNINKKKKLVEKNCDMSLGQNRAL